MTVFGEFQSCMDASRSPLVMNPYRRFAVTTWSPVHMTFLQIRQYFDLQSITPLCKSLYTIKANVNVLRSGI